MPPTPKVQITKEDPGKRCVVQITKEDPGKRCVFTLVHAWLLGSEPRFSCSDRTSLKNWDSRSIWVSGGIPEVNMAMHIVLGIVMAGHDFTCGREVTRSFRL